jgi:hypothetical protein
MSVTYVYQSSATIEKIAPELIVTAAMDDPVFDILPIHPINSSRLRWTIKDNYRGLMGLRGLGGSPVRATIVGTNIYETSPAAFGEFMDIDEIEMTNRAAGVPANMEVPINVADLVSERQEQLTIRQVQRMKHLAYTLLLTGTVTVNLPDGAPGWNNAYTPQTLTVSPLWSSTTTAHPLADLRSLQPTYGFGTSGKFGNMAKMYMNTATANYLLANSLATDLGGKRLDFGQTVNFLPEVNRYLLTADLPQIVIHDDGYVDDAGTFHLWIPTGKVIVVGARPADEQPGNFQITRNINNPDKGARPYAFIKDYTSGAIKTVPPRIEVHQGFNGGPVVQRASQIVIMTVG